MRWFLTTSIMLWQTSQIQAQPVDYIQDVKSVLQQRCFACHGALKQEAGLRLDTTALMIRGGDSGPAIVPGQADASLLIQRVTAHDEAERMPPEGEPLSQTQISGITEWVRTGAAAPEGEQPEEDPRAHWAFQKIVRPDLPEIRSNDSILNEIDLFIAEQHQAHGLTAASGAEKSVLLRRVYLDLIGLPPTRRQLQAFVADESPDAYERVVSQLLDSPQYGERWARHWMDVWRYSDWYGRRHVPDVWNSAPQVWRWRDWIVESLNQDHGYDRMIQEMLAADEVAPEDNEAGYATGYLVRNWYALNPNDWMRNIVEHTGKAFLGLTFNCAHCHDHKYDPIAHDDYFRFRAFFEPVYIRQDQVPGEASPGPFEDYTYGKLRTIQQLGAVRIFDKEPEAPTWFYTGGDERNRVEDRGSIPPGVPAFLADSLPEIEPVALPPRAWYPGLRPEIQETVLAEATKLVAAAEQQVLAAKQAMAEISQTASERVTQAEADHADARTAILQTKHQQALAGRQSLLFNANSGRRVLQNRLPGLKALEDGFRIEFQLLILKNTHFNFQLVKDVEKGLTATCVAFEKGRILSYRPGSVSEFETGRYRHSEQQHFQVMLELHTEADECLLTVRSLSDDALLVDAAPVALNGWNPVGDSLKAISFDARSGSVAVVDELILTPGHQPASRSDAPGMAVAHFDFEPPACVTGKDVAGIGSWEVSQFSISPAVSVVTDSIADTFLETQKPTIEAAHPAAQQTEAGLKAAQAKEAAARAGLASVQARIAADRAQYGETPDQDVAALTMAATEAEREAALRRAEAAVLAQEYALTQAETLPADNSERATKIAAATKELAAARSQLEKAGQVLAEEPTGDYTAFSPKYPKTSTGRRRALSQWITSRENPLTARVAVNHMWLRHFHVPLVSTVSDFGRNGEPPTHPRLLDWLAAELIESGWKMKHVHRLMVCSAAYRRTSDSTRHRQGQADPANRLLWRMNTGRMEAEVIRDSLLHCGGQLDETMGGQPLENSQSLTTFRRSLYYSIFPEQGGQSPLGELFDGPNALDCYRRTRTIIPQQALAMTNSELVHQMSAALVAAWQPQTNEPVSETTGTESFLVAMFETILSRRPSTDESRICVDAFRTQLELSQKAGHKDAAAEQRAMESLVRVLFSHNDFVNIR